MRKAVRNLSLISFSGLLVVSTIGCGDDDTEQTGNLQTATSFQAATMSTMIRGPEGLSLDTQVWYPTLSGEEENFAYDPEGLTRGSIVINGMASCMQPRPVIIFSHGNGGIAYQSFRYSEALARRGYIVVAPNHKFDSLFDKDDAWWAGVAMRRPLDVRAAFDWAAQESRRAGSSLSGCIREEDGYAVIGHSFGGFTALATAGASLDMTEFNKVCNEDAGAGCTRVRQWQKRNPALNRLPTVDERVWAVVALAPAWHTFLGDSLQNINAPTFVIGGESDSLTTWENDVQPAYNMLRSTPRFLARLAEAGHYSFTDFCPFLGPEENGCRAGVANRTFESMDRLTGAFLRYTRGDDAFISMLAPKRRGIIYWEEELGSRTRPEQDNADEFIDI